MLILDIINIPGWVVVLGSTTVATYVYFTWTFDFFSKQGVPGPRPLPVLGNLHSFFRQGWPSFSSSLSKYGKNVGIFIGRKPVLVSLDPEVACQVFVKQFPNFINRRIVRTSDPIVDYSITNSRDEHWKFLRSSMSPAFSTGKLKKMMSEINRCAKQMTENFMDKSVVGEAFDVKSLCGAFTMDVIASTAFGLRVDSQKDKDNEFVLSAKRTFDQTFRPILLVFVIFPFMAKYADKLGVHFVPKETKAFFSRVSEWLMKMREADPDPTRTDFLQVMMNKKLGLDDEDEEEPKTNGPRTGLSTTEIIANSLIFFLAGYETTATTLMFLFYELAVHPECQDKAVEEINYAVGEELDELAYDTLHSFPYLEQCIDETLRLYPPAIRLERQVGRDTEVAGIKLKKGQGVYFPLIGIHHDPERWPDPDRFNPDRFSPENRQNHGPYDFMPFGFGPRQCIAQRLARTELKVALIHLLRQVRFKTCEKTVIPMKLNERAALSKPEQDIYLKVEKRNL